MSEDRADKHTDPREAKDASTPNVQSMGSKVDPDFVPDESHDDPNEKRAREHPEETGS